MSIPAFAQSTPDYANPRSTLNDHTQRNPENDPDFAALVAHSRKLRIDERQRHLTEDAARILALVTKLNGSIKQHQALNEHGALNDEERRMLQDIEKLTRDAKRWMRE